jgi:hypothetical protein
VRALVKNVIAGRTRYGNMEVIPELVPAATTDDRGMFRLAQLSPGSYVVFVPSTQTTVPAALLENADGALRNELFWGGVQEITPLGQPRTVQMGEFALMTLNRVLIPPPPAPSGRMQVYRTTFFPAAATAGGDAGCGEGGRGAHGPHDQLAARACDACLRPARDTRRIDAASAHDPACWRSDDRRHDLRLADRPE